MDPNVVERVVVVGAGTMGNGIAQVFARAGIEAEILNKRDKLYLKMLDLMSEVKAFDPV